MAAMRTNQTDSCSPEPPNKPVVLTVRAASLRSAARPAADRPAVGPMGGTAMIEVATTRDGQRGGYARGWRAGLVA
jgi:hypothetical protein